MGLTEKRVRDAKPSERERIYWDDEIAGLGLRIWPTGRKAFVLNYRVDGRQRRITLGRVGELSLAKAREQAGAMLLAARHGDDPLAAREARRALPTVSDALDRFLNDHIPKRRALGRMAESTAHAYARQIERIIRPAIGRRRVADVTRKDIEAMLRPLRPVMANRVLALVSAFFMRCEAWEMRSQNSNPAKGIEKTREVARDRTLSADELSRLGRALETIKGNPSAILAIRLAALTGLRIGEVRAMRWDEVDLSNGVLTLPMTKTGRRLHTLPTAALQLIASATKVGPYIIFGRSPDTPLDYRTIQGWFQAACREAGIKGTRLHDLRRTIMTDAAATGVGAHLLRDMVGHKTTAMADRYIRQAGEPLVELRERIGASMAAKLAGQSGDVVTLSKGRR